MTRHGLPVCWIVARLSLAGLAACSARAPRAGDPELARARKDLDQLLAGADLGAEPAVVVQPIEARAAVLARAAGLAACAPTRRDLGVLVRDGQPIAFDRALSRDPAVEQCLTAALGAQPPPALPAPALPARVVFVPAYLPGGKPQVLKIDPSTSALPLDDLNPTVETSIVVAPGVDPARVSQLLDRLHAKGFEKLALRVQE